MDIIHLKDLPTAVADNEELSNNPFARIALAKALLEPLDSSHWRFASGSIRVEQGFTRTDLDGETVNVAVLSVYHRQSNKPIGRFNVALHLENSCNFPDLIMVTRELVAGC